MNRGMAEALIKQFHENGEEKRQEDDECNYQNFVLVSFFQIGSLQSDVI